MDSVISGVCPGCGHELNVAPSAKRFACERCGEELVLSPDKRIFLAHPISRYNVPSPRSERIDIDSHLLIRPGSRQKLSEDQRRQTAAGLAAEKLARRKIESNRLLLAGLGVLALGTFVTVLTIMRLLLGGGAWLDLALTVVGILVLVPVGVYLIILSVMVARLVRSQEAELRRERLGL
jgi:hypothetical protein